MITELLDTAINECVVSRYYITEFQLGKEPMQIFVNEAKSMMGSYGADIAKITQYKGIRVREHESNDAVMYSIAVKLNTLTQPEFPSDRIERGSQK